MKKSYPEFSLEVDEGTIYFFEIITAFGYSISKTTFAKILAGVEKPDTGRLRRI